MPVRRSEAGLRGSGGNGACLKYNGGVPKTELTAENLDALKKGIVNLQVHIENMKKYGVPVVVAINRFHTDTDAELNFIRSFCEELGAEVSMAEVFAKGGEGGMDLAEKVCKTIETKPPTSACCTTLS